MTENRKGRDGGDRATLKQFDADNYNSNAPHITGQSAEVLSLIRQRPVLSFVLTADHAIPEAAARVHDLRAKGYHVITQIVPEVEFRGRIRRNVALYSLGVPEWPAPGFLADERGNDANGHAWCLASCVC